MTCFRSHTLFASKAGQHLIAEGIVLGDEGEVFKSCSRAAGPLHNSMADVLAPLVPAPFARFLLASAAPLSDKVPPDDSHCTPTAGVLSGRFCRSAAGKRWQPLTLESGGLMQRHCGYEGR